MNTTSCGAAAPQRRVPTARGRSPLLSRHKGFLGITALLFILISLSSGVFAAWVFRSATLHTMTTGDVNVTNAGSSAIRITGVDCAWESSATTTITISRIRDSKTTALVAKSVVGATSLAIFADEFAGASFIRDDVINITDSLTNNTNYLILSLEGAE